MEESRWKEKEAEVKRMTDEIKNKCNVGTRGIYTISLIGCLIGTGNEKRSWHTNILTINSNSSQIAFQIN